MGSRIITTLLWGGGLLLVALVFSVTAEAELMEEEKKKGFFGRSKELSLMVPAEHTMGTPYVGGVLDLTCEEGSGKMEGTLGLTQYRLKNSNRGECGNAAVSFRSDTHDWTEWTAYSSIWNRPPGPNTLITFVSTTQLDTRSSCPAPLADRYLDLFRFVYDLISTKYLYATISDIDMSSDGYNKVSESPEIRFNTEKVRSDLIELHNRCRKKE